MLKILAELCLALYMLILPSAATAETESVSSPTAEVTKTADVEVYSYMDEGAMLARLENILNHNYSFGSDFESDEMLVLNAQLALHEKCADGYIEKTLVDSFVYSMYGVEPGDVFLDFAEPREGYYPVLPRGFEKYTHTVTGYSYVGDGSITVSSDMLITYPGGETETAKCESVLFADGSSAFGYTLLSCEII